MAVHLNGTSTSRNMKVAFVAVVITAVAQGASALWCGCWDKNGAAGIFGKEDIWNPNSSDTCCIMATGSKLLSGPSFFGATQNGWCDTGNSNSEGFRQCCDIEERQYTKCK